MKIVLLAGNAPNQVALASKVAFSFNLAGVIIEKRLSKKKKTAADYINALLDRTIFNSLRLAWPGMLEYYKEHFDFPEVRQLTVASVNSREAIQFLKEAAPDLIMVSGTSLVKKEVLQLNPPLGIINLHTGISPYVKGGPNCTNWCMANDEMHLIGNTVMYLNEGIDSGKIIATEFTPLGGDETLLQLHIKVMEHAHDLYIRCLSLIEKKGKVPAIVQSSIAKGHVYYTRDWNMGKKLKAISNFKKLKRSVDSIKEKQKEVIIVNPFPENTSSNH